jgi:tagaturonate reductase
VITPDITLFKELKLRLLNGTHTFNCGLAYLSGFNITREAVTDKVYSVFTKNLMHQEIANAIPFEIDKKVKADFADNVFERFCNPFIDHKWISITVQYTSKMKMRNIPLIARHYELNENPPLHIATGFAGFLLFMKAIKKENGKYFGERNGAAYEIKDDSAEYFYNVWKDKPASEVAKEVMQDENMWGTDLTDLPGFLSAVQEQLNEMMTNGVLETIAELEKSKVSV